MGESSADVHMSAAASLGVNLPPAMTELPSPMSPMLPDRRTPSPGPMPPDLPFPKSLSRPEIRTSPPLPPLTQAGRPVRSYIFQRGITHLKPGAGRGNREGCWCRVAVVIRSLAVVYIIYNNN